MNSIFEYLNYRDYLRDYYEMKKEEGNFSYRLFSKQAGFSSPNFIKLVIEGKSKLSKTSAAKLAKVMGLYKASRKYFHRLVLLEQADSIDDKMEQLAEMKQLTRDLKIHQLNSDQLEFYSSWHHPVVRELVGMLKGASDPQEICDHIIPKIEVSEVVASIKLLKRLRMLKKNEFGELAPKDTIVSSEGMPMGNLVIRSTQKRLAELGGEAIEKVDPDERNISGLTVAVPENQLNAISTELQRCRRRIMEIAQNSEEADRVYRLNLHLFPLSKRVDGDEKGETI